MRKYNLGNTLNFNKIYLTNNKLVCINKNIFA